MRTAFFGLLYLPLFIGISAFLKWKNITNVLAYSIVNLFINILIFMINFSLRDLSFHEVSNLFFAMLLASAIIIVSVKIMNSRKPPRTPSGVQ
jgi:hypothetical protein